VFVLFFLVYLSPQQQLQNAECRMHEPRTTPATATSEAHKQAPSSEEDLGGLLIGFQRGLTNRALCPLPRLQKHCGILFTHTQVPTWNAGDRCCGIFANDAKLLLMLAPHPTPYPVREEFLSKPSLFNISVQPECIQQLILWHKTWTWV
jgi:hypothetical protein